MKTSHPSYIVADIPEPIHSSVIKLRRSCCNRTDNIPAEITLAGSSGCGPIPTGTDVSLVIEEVSEILKDIHSFQQHFTEWRVFPNTTIAYLAPSDRSIFDLLHRSLLDSKIPYSPIDFPYNPHCTIGSSWTQEALESITEIPFPEEQFTISSIRFLQLDNQTLNCDELAAFKLSSANKSQQSNR